MWIIREASDRHTQLKTIRPRSYIVGSNNSIGTVCNLKSIQEVKLNETARSWYHATVASKVTTYGKIEILLFYKHFNALGSKDPKG